MTQTDRPNGRSTTTATVEVLTAEVRTLMVGSRQVTQSVYKQLDWVEPEHVEPFGRFGVDQGRRLYSSDHVTVVGRHRQTGALVRSQAAPVDEFSHDRITEPPHELGPIVFELAEETETVHAGHPYERIQVNWPKMEEERNATLVTVAVDPGGCSVRWAVWTRRGSNYDDQGKGKRYRHNSDLPPRTVRWAPEIDSDEAQEWANGTLLPVVEADRRYREWSALPLIVLAGLR
jgi:hypothetical protein